MITEAMKQFAEYITTPTGFSKVVVERENHIQVNLGKDFTDIRIDIFPSTDEYFGGYIFQGHTTFETCNGRMTFDRTGVSDSFSGDAAHHQEFDVDNIIIMQLVRVKEAQVAEMSKKRLPTPLNSFRRTPEEIEVIIRRLQNGEFVSLLPSGFGTGYELRTKSSPYAIAASKELCDYFAVPRLYLTSLDCD